MQPTERSVRVLLVEDNRDTANTLATLLTRSGYEVRTVYSGLDAMGAAEAFEPDCIVSDIGLPGVDGYTLAERFRRHDSFRRTPLIALTAYADPERAKSAGFDEHLVKPTGLRTLAELINELTSVRKQMEATAQGQEQVLTAVKSLAGDVKELKEELKEEVQELKAELREVKEDVAEIKEQLEDATGEDDSGRA